MQELLDRLRALKNELENTSFQDWDVVDVWGKKALPTIAKNLSEHLDEFKSLLKKPIYPRGLSGMISRPDPKSPKYIFSPEDYKEDQIEWLESERRNKQQSESEAAGYRQNCENAHKKILAFLDGIIHETEKSKPAANTKTDYFSLVEQICSRFHLVAQQIEARHDKRETLHVKDEYDVQDLLHSLLHIHFDDIRREEWTPSDAGRCSRVDFLLKDEKIIIEVKKTRQNLKAKDVGEELIIDLHHYKVHPDCKKLLCFVYDPEGWISNPRGLENDLNKKEDDFEIKVLIVPKWH